VSALESVTFIQVFHYMHMYNIILANSLNYCTYTQHVLVLYRRGWPERACEYFSLERAI